ncbi:hypothetical protein C0Q70_01500 [Pomacea canaliculata]|uniref:Uncharacterized protein n=1 Tax=Pomacea canaliculata TaxID=400727 RepID=A0A2T7PZM3_POMCA|nr:hypothetical protein C0Q70_01500 [Pomacea canaliculata]
MKRGNEREKDENGLDPIKTHFPGVGNLLFIGPRGPHGGMAGPGDPVGSQSSSPPRCATLCCNDTIASWYDISVQATKATTSVSTDSAKPAHNQTIILEHRLAGIARWVAAAFVSSLVSGVRFSIAAGHTARTPHRAARHCIIVATAAEEQSTPN